MPLATIVEGAVEHLAHQPSGELRPDRTQRSQGLDLAGVGMLRSCLFDDSVSLCFDLGDHPQHQFQAVQLAQHFRLQSARQGAPVAGSQTFDLRLASAFRG
jgi:hypothetical protein